MIVIIDYGMGNLRSVQKGFEKIGQTATVTSAAIRYRCSMVLFRQCVPSAEKRTR